AVARVFLRPGSVSSVPHVGVERGEVRPVLGDSVIASRSTALGLVFTDSSLTELERQVTFAAGTVGPDAAGLLGDALDHLIDGRTRMVMRQTLMTALLDGSANGFFY